MPKIPVPKPAANSFNKHRPVSDLLRWQIRHTHEAERKLPVDHQTGINIHEIKTEHEAGVYLQKVTAKLVEKVHLKTRIRVPKPPRSAHNQNRPISQLLKNHVLHFYEMEKGLPPREQTGTDIETLLTEGKAAAYINTITGKLLDQGNKNQGNKNQGDKKK